MSTDKAGKKQVVGPVAGVCVGMIIAIVAMLAFATIDVATVDAADVAIETVDQFDAQDDVAPADDTRLSVQLWTLLAAGGAAAVALVLFLLRVVLGRVKQPPPQEDGGGH